MTTTVNTRSGRRWRHRNRRYRRLRLRVSGAVGRALGQRLGRGRGRAGRGGVGRLRGGGGEDLNKEKGVVGGGLGDMGVIAREGGVDSCNMPYIVFGAVVGRMFMGGKTSTPCGVYLQSVL